MVVTCKMKVLSCLTQISANFLFLLFSKNFSFGNFFQDFAHEKIFCFQNEIFFLFQYNKIFFLSLSYIFFLSLSETIEKSKTFSAKFSQIFCGSLLMGRSVGRNVEKGLYLTVFNGLYRATIF